jgi:DNA-binding CsgD family transcriptional regulator
MPSRLPHAAGACGHDRGAGLTPTERRVAGFVAEGLSNPQIGECMAISPATVKSHVSHIFAKLDMSSRSQIATEATRRLLS